jgi:hypothetical protein
VSRLQCSRSSPRAPRCSRVSWRTGSALANSRPLRTGAIAAAHLFSPVCSRPRLRGLTPALQL